MEGDGDVLPQRSREGRLTYDDLVEFPADSIEGVGDLARETEDLGHWYGAAGVRSASVSPSTSSITSAVRSPASSRPQIAAMFG